MVVAVTLVRMMQVAVDQVVDVVAVGNRFVPAARLVPVAGLVAAALVIGRAALGVGALHGDGVLVHVAGVLVVQVPVVQVVHVVLVAQRGVAAPGLVAVVVILMERSLVARHVPKVLRTRDGCPAVRGPRPEMRAILIIGYRCAPMRRALATAAALAALAAAPGCGDDADPGSPDAAIRVVATTSQVADLVRNVGGDRVAVEQMLQPNADPHDFEPRPSDATAVSDAAVVFRSGGDLDDWLDGLLDNAGTDAEVVSLIETVARRRGDEGVDPHWWQDPRNGVLAVAAIRAALAGSDPQGRATYARNAARYTARLRRLDRGIAACVRELPERKRKLVTTHDALGYYADRYGLEVIGAVIPALSTQAQPSAKDTERLVDQIERQDVEAIFPESSINPKLERAVARETGAEVGRALYADTLGPKGSRGATYVGSLRANTEAIVGGLSAGAVSCRGLPR
jgi:zinc/manganese transport system substrate-binding protein